MEEQKANYKNFLKSGIEPIKFHFNFGLQGIKFSFFYEKK